MNQIDENKIYEFVVQPLFEKYYNDENNFAIYEFMTTENVPMAKCETMMIDGDVCEVKTGTLIGNYQRLIIGTKYRVNANLKYSERFGRYDFCPSNVIALLPKTTAEQLLFLKTQTTPKLAEAIISKYPNIVEDVAKGVPVDATDVKGLGQKSWNTLRNKIIENYTMSDLLNLLCPLGFTNNLVHRLFKSTNNPELLQQKIIDNPYFLTEIKGFGFITVDKIAKKLNPNSINTLERTLAFIRYYFSEELSSNGHTYCTLEELKENVKTYIPECVSVYEEFINTPEQYQMFLTSHDDKIGLRSIYNIEYGIVNRLKEIDKSYSNFNIDIEQGISEAEKMQGFTYTEEQKEYIYKACKTNVVFISGLAGTGKTTIIRALINIYSDYSIGTCALSAKAAQRIKEATNRDSSTIHSMLRIGEGGTASIFNEKNPCPYDVVIVDESSMINSELFLTIVNAVKNGTKLIFCGDDGQLPPIGMGNPFYDILRLKQFNCCKLTKILRQAEKSGIITDSKIIRCNKSPLEEPSLKVVTGELKDMTYMFRDNPEDMRNIAIRQYFKSVEKSGIENTIIITPCKQNKLNSTREINTIIQSKLFDDSVPSVTFGNKKFCVGDRVIERKNKKIEFKTSDIQGSGLFDEKIMKKFPNIVATKTIHNGDIGVIRYINNGYLYVEFESLTDKDNDIVIIGHENFVDIELAYCLTVHVTQGSGYENVIAIVDNSHYVLLDSCLLYTALTRAKKRCLLISQPAAFKQCIRNKASRRNTWLSLEYRK